MTSGSDLYLRAVKEAEKVDSPAIGFCDTTGLGPNTLARSAVRQNNTIIELVVQLAGKVRDLEEQIQVLKEEVRLTTKGKGADISEDLVSRLEKINLGGTTKRIPEAEGKLRVYKDPRKIRP